MALNLLYLPIYILIAVSVTSVASQTLDPDWTVTCVRDKMTIVVKATDGVDANTVPRLDLGIDTADYEDAGNGDTTVITGCPNTLTHPADSCEGDTGGPCETTLIVDLTIVPPGDTNGCPPNTVTTDPGHIDYTKKVLWRRRNLNTELGDNTVNSGDVELYEITCRIVDSITTDATTGEVIVTLLDAPVVDPFTPASPTVSIKVLAKAAQDDVLFTVENPPSAKLGDDLRLQVEFDDGNQNYWQQIVATSCEAAPTSGFVQAQTHSLITNKCPVFNIETQNIFIGYDYPETDQTEGPGPLADSALLGKQFKTMNLDFNAFRISAERTIYLRCFVTICRDFTTAEGGNPVTCQRPADINVGTSTCTPPTARNRYHRLMMASSKSTSTRSTPYEAQLSTVLVLQPGNVIITEDGKAADGYTCLTTGAFAALVSLLGLLALVSITITVTVCMTRRGGNKMELPMTYTNHALSKA